MNKLTKQDKKNMDTIIRSVFAHKMNHDKAPNNKPSKKVMEQKYQYDSQSNTFIKFH